MFEISFYRLQRTTKKVVTKKVVIWRILLNSVLSWILQSLATNRALQNGEYPTSTIYSALKRLQKDGYVIYSDRYEIEDPFFKEWIRRGM